MTRILPVTEDAMFIVVQLCGALARIAVVPVAVLMVVIGTGADDQLVEGIAGLMQIGDVLR